jgi:hypothetical protein
MVYVIIYLQPEIRSDYLITETKTFRSIKALMDYCFHVKKANYVEFEESYDASFDYFIHLKGVHK